MDIVFAQFCFWVVEPDKMDELPEEVVEELDDDGWLVKPSPETPGVAVDPDKSFGLGTQTNVYASLIDFEIDQNGSRELLTKWEGLNRGLSAAGQEMVNEAIRLYRRQFEDWKDSHIITSKEVFLIGAWNVKTSVYDNDYDLEWLGIVPNENLQLMWPRKNRVDSALDALAKLEKAER